MRTYIIYSDANPPKRGLARRVYDAFKHDGAKVIALQYDPAIRRQFRSNEGRFRITVDYGRGKSSGYADWDAAAERAVYLWWEPSGRRHSWFVGPNPVSARCDTLQTLSGQHVEGTVYHYGSWGWGWYYRLTFGNQTFGNWHDNRDAPVHSKNTQSQATAALLKILDELIDRERQLLLDMNTRIEPTFASSSTIQWNHERPEYYEFFASRFDVRTAKQLIDLYPRSIRQMRIGERLKAEFGKPFFELEFGEWETDENGRRFQRAINIDDSGIIGVDWHRAASDEIDLKIPLIIAQIKREQTHTIIIDGMHRIAKAIMQGIETLPCVYLTVEETEQIL